MTAETYVRLRAGGEHFAVPVAQALEVVEVAKVAPVPGAHDAVLGVCNLRGRILALVDLAAALGLPPGEVRRALVVEDGAALAGLGVEDVAGVAELPELEERERGRLRGSALVDGELVGVVDLGALFERLAQRR